MTDYTSEEVERVAKGLSDGDRNALLGAQMADCQEYWLTSPVEDQRLASSDWVVRPLGLAVRQHLIGTGEGGRDG